MMKPSPHWMAFPENQVNAVGQIRAAAENVTVQSGNRFVAVRRVQFDHEEGFAGGVGLFQGAGRRRQERQVLCLRMDWLVPVAVNAPDSRATRGDEQKDEAVPERRALRH